MRQVTQYSYTRGEATLIEFLDAQRAYNETIQTYNEARAEYARNLFQIDSAQGRRRLDEKTNADGLPTRHDAWLREA